MGIGATHLVSAPWPSNFGISDLVYGLNGSAIGADIVMVLKQYVEIGRLAPAYGSVYWLGSGAANTLQSATGRAYVVLENLTPAAMTGTLRIDVHDPADRVVQTLFQRDLAALGISTNPQEQVVCPWIGFEVPYGYSLVVKVKTGAAAADTWDYDSSSNAFSIAYTQALVA